MTQFSVQLNPHSAAAPDDPCPIRIAVGDLVLTRLLRQPGNQPDDSLIAPPAALAYWLCDNWWRLRWETYPVQAPTADWHLAHNLTSVGGGYAWPHLLIWGDTDRIRILSRSDPIGVVGPVRYLTDALAYVAAGDFEVEVDRFLDQVADEQTGFGSDRAALRALIAALREERSDQDLATWRRLEARLGYDPDEGPEETIAASAQLAGQWGNEGVEEAIASAPGPHAPQELEREVVLARDRGTRCDFSAILAEVGSAPRRATQPPWVVAEEIAARVRQAAGLAPGKVSNSDLAVVLGTPKWALHKAPRGLDRPYGLRLHTDDAPESHRVSLRAHLAVSRRFELCRALGDTLWAPGQPLGPLTDTNTARQQFQRAFAQSLLCPFKDLLDFLQADFLHADFPLADRPDDDDIREAADHFAVSTRVIETILVNKGVIARDRLEGGIEAA